MSKGETIKETIKANLCTGCATCVSLCPRSAIELTKDDSKGIYLPWLNDEECNQCGVCFDVCPGHIVDFKQLNLEIFGKEPEDILIGNYLTCYTGHATDYGIRYNSASGGLVTALLIFALEEGIIDGALVTRMKKDKPLEPEPFIARTKEEIIEAAKSKYCPVPANIALKEILNSKEGERFAVVGLPCHIHGVRKAEQINKNLKDKIVLHFGLFCVTTATFLGTEFLFQERRIAKKDVKRLDYRGEGWPGNMQIELTNGSKKSFQFPAIWSDKTVGNTVLSFSPSRCSLCVDGSCEMADISFADAWIERFKNDKVGRSYIICRNEIGEKLLQKAMSSKKIEIGKIGTNEIIQAQGMLTSKKERLNIFVFLFKILGKNVPIYNKELPELTFNTYFSVIMGYILHYSKIFLASKHLWKLLVLYLALLRYVSCVKSKLKL